MKFKKIFKRLRGLPASMQDLIIKSVPHEIILEKKLDVDKIYDCADTYLNNQRYKMPKAEFLKLKDELY